MTNDFLTFDAICDAVSGRWLNERPVPTDSPVGVVIDSREDLRSSCFIAIIGDRTDGHLWLASAVEGGAAMLIVQEDRLGIIDPEIAAAVPVLVVSDTRKALALLAEAWRVHLRAVVIGITGSAGKTTQCSIC